MSGYLGHLAARTLQTAPIVRPRPMSLFEPTAGLPRNEIITEADLEVMLVDAAQHPVATLAEPRPALIAPAPQPPARRSAGQHPATLTTPAPRTTETEWRPTMERGRRKELAEPSSGPHARPVLDRPFPQPPVQQSAVPERVGWLQRGVEPRRDGEPPEQAVAARPLQRESHTSEPSQPVRLGRAHVGLPAETPVARHSVAPPSLPTPSLKPLLAPPEVRIVPPAVRRIRPPVERVHGWPVRKPQPPAEAEGEANSTRPQVIQVTIGRVEVRAERAQAPRSARSASQPLGLTAYLRERAHRTWR